MKWELHFSWNILIGLVVIAVAGWFFAFHNIVVVFGALLFIFSIVNFAVGVNKTIVR